MEKLLKGAHITITARSEDDVEVDVIMEKLARATASAYKFNEPRGENEGHTGPIGTTYRRYIFLSFCTQVQNINFEREIDEATCQF